MIFSYKMGKSGSNETEIKKVLTSCNIRLFVRDLFWGLPGFFRFVSASSFPQFFLDLPRRNFRPAIYYHT